MSQPYLNQEEFRKMYLASLAKQIAVDKKNYDANEMFKETGQTPAPMPDSRSITEKLSNLEALKTQLRKDLLSLTDLTNTNQILNELTAEETRFLYEQFNAIESTLKPHYRAGIPKEAFIPFFRKYMDKLSETGLVEPSVASQIQENIPVVSGELGTFTPADEITNTAFQNNLRMASINPDGMPASLLNGTIKKGMAELKRQVKVFSATLTDEQIMRRKEIEKSFIKAGGQRSKDNIIRWMKDPSSSQDFADFLKILKDTQGVSGYGIMGTGLTHRRPKVAKGVVEKIRFKQFGRYILDMDKLNDGILCIKTQAEKPISRLPIKRVGKNVVALMKKIVGGDLPAYDDLDVLSNEERKMMNMVAKESRIDDRIKIPSPNKSEEQKEMDDFEILRGSIIAGNDNKDLVRKFKLMLVKFSNDGRIGRNEAREILMDLASAGL